MKYDCYKCLWTTHIKTKMTSHLGRSRPCKNIRRIEINDIIKQYILEGLSYEEYLELTKSKSNISQKSVKKQSDTNEISKKFECSFCNKKYVHNQSLYNHLKTCKEKKKEDEVKDSMTELVQLLNKQIQEQGNMLINIQKELTKKDNELNKRDNKINKQEKQIDELIKKAGIKIDTMNVVANINLLGYKETDRSHLTDNDILKCLKHSNFCIPHLIEKVHFDINKPENHNIYISNLKNKYVMIYDGNKWECKDRDEQIMNLIDDNESIIEYKLEEWIENGNKYPKMMKQFNRYVEKKDNNIVINKIKDDIKLLLYNNRTVVNKELLLEKSI